MRHIIQEIVDTLESFVDHEEQSIMLIEAETEEAPLLLKTFGMVEENELSHDIYLSFGDEFQDTRKYVELVLERQQEQIEQLNIELEKKNLDTIRQIPSELFERNKPSKIRFFELMAHIRKVVDPERQVIWIFYPLSDVSKEEFYLKLFSYVSEKVLAGDLDNTKLIIRDCPSGFLREHLGYGEKNPAVTFYRPELDFQSVLKKLEEQSENENAPEDEKMQSVMLMAGVDVAEKNYDQALEKNERVLSYYKKTKQKENESIVRNNIGDIHYLQGDFPTAQQHYEDAVNISVERKSQPMVLYQSINLGNSLFMQEEYEEAFIYYDSAEKLADANKILAQRIHAMERMGKTKHCLKEIDEAREIYEKAAEICRKEEFKLGLRSILHGLMELHEGENDTENHKKCEKEYNRITKELEDIEPNLVKEASAQ
ncbi:MAG: tetratricopeptide repeat protein [Pyrinomonadaceae bacterium]|nr:tetratricopeptide repeat protein [Pyrinomonadaceae bacterium]